MSFQKPIDRRDFIRGIGALGVAASLPATAAAVPFAFLPGARQTNPEREVDP